MQRASVLRTVFGICLLACSYMAVVSGLIAVGGTASWGTRERNATLTSWTIQAIVWAAGALLFGFLLSWISEPNSWFHSKTTKAAMASLFVVFMVFVVLGARVWYR